MMIYRVCVWLMDVVHAHYVYEGARRPWASVACRTRARAVSCRVVRVVRAFGIDDDGVDGHRRARARAEDDEDEDEDEVFIVDCTGVDCIIIFSDCARTSTTTGCDARCASRCA